MQVRTFRGTRDILPQLMLLRQQVTDRVRAVFERHGFDPIDTPAIEYLEILQGKYGDEEKLIYRFQDHGGRDVALRYDLTVPLARFVAQHRHELAFPFKRYHIGPVWRGERPQKGRYRQFTQCDFDIVGTASPLADAEVVAVIVEALQALAFRDFQVLINHRDLLEALARRAGVPAELSREVYRAVDKLEKIGPDGVREELARLGVPAGAADALLERLGLEGDPEAVLEALAADLAEDEAGAAAVATLRELIRYLDALGVPRAHWTLSLRLARGLAYYTGPVFEAVVREPKIGSVSGGGRYDRLVGIFSGQDLPTTGASLGLDRIVDVILELGLLEAPRTVAQVLVTLFDADHLLPALALARELRAAGLRADLYPEPARLRKQLRYADQKGVPYVLILGPDELAADAVVCKALATGEQWTWPRREAAARLKALLGGGA